MIDSIIRQRRTIKPAFMNGGKISDDLINLLTELADWAPTHGRTEPWRFIIFPPNKLSEFCEQQASLYRENSSPDKFKEATYDKLLHAADGASHAIVAYMKRGTNPNIPEIEEIAATAAAIQNLLLGAESHKIATFWSTTGPVHKERFKEHFGLQEEDRVLGILYLGLTDEISKEGKRSIPLSEKVKWMR